MAPHAEPISTDEHHDPDKILFFTWDVIWDADGVVQKWHRPKRHTLEEYPAVAARVPDAVRPFPAQPRVEANLRGKGERTAQQRMIDGAWLDRHDPDPARRYKYVGMQGWNQPGWPPVEPWTRCFYTATSPDGKTWTEPRPMPNMGETGDTMGFIYDERARLYRLFTRSRGYWIASEKVPEFLKRPRKKGMPEGRWISLTSSTDFETWTPLEIILNKDPRDEESTQFYCLMAFPYGNIYLGYLRIHNEWEGTMATELIWSRDCLRWQRAYNRMAFTSPGDLGEFDWCFGNLANTRPFRHDDTLYMLYEGREHVHAPHAVKTTGGGTLDLGMSLCTMRVDGFVSLESGRMGGHLTTEPLPLAGKTLSMNARCVRDGSIRIERCDRDGKILSTTPCLFTGDSIDAPVVIDGQTVFGSDAPDGVRLRLTMKDAALYSLSVRPPS